MDSTVSIPQPAINVDRFKAVRIFETIRQGDSVTVVVHGRAVVGRAVAYNMNTRTWTLMPQGLPQISIPVIATAENVLSMSMGSRK